ncbi:hypothetical protein B2G71_04705 [Novosphingobium sp. PC22D]|uniref:phytanoyl-CoA dioxygenase family protein n=1 Tax=Novosphingobium sp. PC22D TaxID=1962403 RepID=UPI000BF1D0FE|nr:phytanoyl-CoA dioxygenase family protein [Novosphingobium sp. PC22D]PEQ13632.1 hypothetical protein B2G71_04705 [Novosphingobium sp. PC22D]
MSLDAFADPAIADDLDRQGFSVVDNALDRDTAARLGTRLREIARDLRERGISTHTPIIDPNAHNVRIYDLPDHDPAFVDLLTAPEVTRAVDACLGPDWIISNFTANIARPGARAMKIHSDMALVFPGPWRERWALNVIWCLDDIDEENGATRYLPGSHLISRLEDLPSQAAAATLPFEARAGSAIVLDGRTWHCSGDNVSRDRDRALLFAYYARGFIRPQACWHETLRPETIAALDERQRAMFGFGPLGNTHGVPLIALS